MRSKKVYDKKTIKKKILNTLNKCGYSNIKENYFLNNKKYDYVYFSKNKPLIVVNIKNDKVISKRMINNFEKKLKNESIYFGFLTNGNQLIKYDLKNDDVSILKLNEFPYESELINICKSGNLTFLITSIILLIIIIFVIVLGLLKYKVSKQNAEIEKGILELEKQNELSLEYQDCIKSKQDFSDSEEIIAYKNGLDDYLKQYQTSILYENLDLGYSYSYNTSKVYYAASTIKTLDALYLYTKSYNEGLDLDQTITYTSKYLISDSDGVKKHKVGDQISLRELISYAIRYSDNAAHAMLIDYIGLNNLKEFGLSLGAKYTLYGSDTFGSITVLDAEAYLKYLDSFINTANELGQELKENFIYSKHNDLKLVGIDAATKYGYYGAYFHNIGIVYDESRYILAVLTTEASGNFDNKIKDINSKIYYLHRLYYTNHLDNCYKKVYGEN